MKRLFVLFALVVTALLLVSCDEVTDEVIKKKEPSVELKVEGNLLQNYDDASTLEDVLFDAVFHNFEENEITKYEVNWYVNDVLFSEYKNALKYTQEVKSPGNIAIKVVVTYDGGKKRLEATQLIEVTKTPVKLVLSAPSHGTNNIPLTLGENTNVEFDVAIEGIFTEADQNFNWIIKKSTTGEPVEVKRIPVTSYNQIEGDLKLYTSFDFNFSTLGAGNYLVTLEKGKEGSLDANTYISNTIFVNVGYGEFAINLLGDAVLTSNYAPRTLTINGIDSTGTYEWYLNGELLENENGLTLVHNDLEVGGFLYRVKYTSLDGTKSAFTDPVLLVNGVLVHDAEELLTAVTDGVAGIVFANDITYNVILEGKDTTETLKIKSPLTIHGMGHELIGPGIQEFIHVLSDNVNISSVHMSHSNKYGIKVQEAERVYLENLIFEDFGGTNINDFKKGDFNSGVYVDRSDVIVNNIEFLSSGLVGIRIDQHLNTSGVSRLELLGELKYNPEDSVLMPIGSGKSDLDGIEVIAQGFNYFALPAGEIVIRRWDNQGDPIGWQIYDQQKTEYKVGDPLDIYLIGINIDISFLGNFEIASEDGLAFVEMYISWFHQYGIVEITDLDDEVIVENGKEFIYYVVGFDDNITSRNDKVIYSLEKETYSDKWDTSKHVEPQLPTTPGTYKMKIFIGEEFYLGHVLITVVE